MEDGHADVPLQPVYEVVGGVAGDGDGGAAAVFQHPGVSQQAGVQLLRVAGQDGGGAVGHFGVGQDEGGQVILIPGGVGAIQHELVKHLGGLGAHAAQDA